MIFVIARQELRRLFLSPLAWTILGVVQFVLAWMFLQSVNNFLVVQSQLLGMGGEYGITELVVMPLLGNAAVVLLLITPLVSMRLVTEERRNKTLALLFSAPLSMTEIALGKYLGLVAFLALQLLLVALMPLSLLSGSGLDLGMFGSGLLGLLLLIGAFAAVGLFLSTLTQHQTIAAVGTFGVLLFFWLLDWARTGADGGVLPYLSLLNHYEPFLKGVFDTRDAIFQLLFIGTFLALSVRRLDMDRLGG
jgi:ABC-2 type transport system permease protein